MKRSAPTRNQHGQEEGEGAGSEYLLPRSVTEVGTGTHTATVKLVWPPRACHAHFLTSFCTGQAEKFLSDYPLKIFTDLCTL